MLCWWDHLPGGCCLTVIIVIIMQMPVLQKTHADGVEARPSTCIRTLMRHNTSVLMSSMIASCLHPAVPQHRIWTSPERH